MAMLKKKTRKAIQKTFKKFVNKHAPTVAEHVDQGGVDHCFTVRVIVTAGVATDLCAFTVLAAREKR